MEDRSPSRALIAGAGVVVAVVAAVTAVLVLRPEGQRAAVAEAAPPPRAVTPFEQAERSLATQAEALLDGDEKGWLAAVDPDRAALRKQYRAMFRNLRGLDVTHLEYHVYSRVDAAKKPGSVELTAHLAYCFSMPTCPEWRRDPNSGPPRITRNLTLAPLDGRYVITEIDDPYGNHLQPTPWEDAELTMLRGRRVTVAGPKGLAKHLKRVLTVAEKAAATSDRFARYMDNPQKRYRIYIADKKSWGAWYGGMSGDWAVGYAIPLHTAGTDVILRAGKLGSDEQLRTTVKHELGHAVTLGGTPIRDFDSDQWLSEGIAEYIGWHPKAAVESWNRYSVREAFRGGSPPRTIVSKPIDDKSSDRSVNTFYAMGHFAADCLADRYGEESLFEFVRLTLREDRTHDQASRAAFGEAFATADKACVRWIKDEVG